MTTRIDCCRAIFAASLFKEPASMNLGPELRPVHLIGRRIYLGFRSYCERTLIHIQFPMSGNTPSSSPPPL